MKRLRAVVAALGTAGTTVVAAALAMGYAGCGDDTSGAAPDSSADTTTDSPDESTGDDVVTTETGPDVGPDTNTVETGADADASVPPDADAGTVDVVDSGMDADAEAGFPRPPLDWSDQEAIAFCTGILNCCPGGLDSGVYDMFQCHSAFRSEGWFEYTLPTRADLYPDNHIAFNADAGAACLAALQNYQCGAKTAAYWQSITNACFAALQGTIPAGTGGCRSSFECAPGNFCDSTVDGGLCSPLVGQGQPCGTSAPRDEMCSYLGSDSPALWCNTLDGGSTCQPLLSNGSVCAAGPNIYDMSCTSGLCGDDNLCGDTTAAPFPFFCQFYTIKDAGGGG